MQFMILLLALLSYTGLVQSSVDELPVHPGVGGFYKGPNSETIIKGPDGSVITAQQEGGAIITQDASQPIVVADTVEEGINPIIPVAVEPEVLTAPVSLQQVESVVPAVTVSSEPAVVAALIAAVPIGHTVEVIQPDPHIIETEFVDTPVVEPQQSFDLVGPSGSISTRGSSSIVSGPASTTISEPAKILVATPLVAAVPVISTVTTPLRAIPLVTSATAAVPSPAVSTVTVAPVIIDNSSPQVLVSSLAPPTDLSSIPISVSTLSPSLGVVSTTAAPAPVWEDNQISSLSTPLPVATVTQQGGINQVTSGNIGASVQPSSSYGVINNLNKVAQVFSTSHPEGVLSSTLPPVLHSTTPSTNLDLINNRQLSINPSLIPSANIIPAEIGPLPAGAIDLGTTVTVSTTPRVPTPTESPNIQRISSDNTVLLNSNNRGVDGRLANLQKTSIQTDGRLGTNQVTAQNQIVFSGSRQTSPVGIPRNGIVGSRLANYGIDPTQIDLANVPLSSVSGIPQTLDQEIDDVSAQLWTRYGRDVKEKRTKGGKEQEI